MWNETTVTQCDQVYNRSLGEHRDGTLTGVIRSSELKWIKEGFTEEIFQLKLERWIGFFRAQKEEIIFQAEKAACVRSQSPWAQGKQRGAEMQGACGGVGDSCEEPSSDQAGGRGRGFISLRQHLEIQHSHSWNPIYSLYARHCAKPSSI